MHEETNALRKQGFEMIAGVDEAGRGPLAGPVVAAAVIFDGNYKNALIRDSKALKPMLREELFIEIKNHCISYAVGVVPASKIDTMGILNATKFAMRQAVLKLDPRPDFVLTDAVALNIMEIPQKAIVKGDAKVFSIAAASIIAKVTRDHMMVKYAKKYPGYSFDQHMGYGTELHLKAIKELGASPIHRKTFAPLK